MTIDYYRVLNLPHDATLDQIHSVFRSLAREYHPDRNRGSRAGEAASHMVLINEAYTCLSDSSRRRGYDESLRIAEPPLLQRAVLDGAEDLLRRSDWRRMEIGNGDKILESGKRRVSIRFATAFGHPELNHWTRFVNGLFRRNLADCAAVLAFRILAAADVPRAVASLERPATVIDLVESRMFGSDFPGAEYETLFRPFLIV